MLSRIQKSIVTIVSIAAFMSIGMIVQSVAQYDLSQFSLGPARLSTDTTPVKIKVGSIIYYIPRNYMEYPNQNSPVLKLTYPGYKPFSNETRNCFLKIIPNDPAECRTIRFVLLGSTGPGPGGRAFTNGEMFENFKRNTPELPPPRHRPSGYDIYDVGPFPDRTETYRRADGNSFVHCLITYENDRDRSSVCNDLFALDDGNHVHAFLYPHQIRIVPEFEATIRKIIASFKHEGVTQ